ncbi:MAG: histidine kinase dimerization/phospho-acceptor domain-containing protein [Pseudomonadales bacterium]
MRWFNYYQHRIALSFGIFSVTLSLLFGYTLFVSIHDADDSLREALILKFEQHFLDYYARTGDYLNREQAFEMNILLEGRDPIESHLTELPMGYNEIGIRSVHVVKGQLPDKSAQVYYLIHHTAKSHAINQNRTQILSAIALTIAFISVLGISIGLLLSRQLARPVQALQRQIRNTDLESAPSRATTRSDEFGEISRVYAETIDQMRATFAREKRFSSYASHELRTPVSIVKSSLSLWRNCEQAEPSAQVEQKKQRAIERIDVACEQMEQVIQSFLHLSRRSLDNQPKGWVDMTQLLQQLLDKYQSVENYQSVVVQAALESQAYCETYPQTAQILFSTLLRNSFEYCATSLQVSVSADRIELINDIDSLKVARAEHFGFGLDIVKQLCQQLNWQLELEQREQSFRVCIQIADALDKPQNS